MERKVFEVGRMCKQFSLKSGISFKRDDVAEILVQHGAIEIENAVNSLRWNMRQTRLVYDTLNMIPQPKAPYATEAREMYKIKVMKIEAFKLYITIYNHWRALSEIVACWICLADSHKNILKQLYCLDLRVTPRLMTLIVLEPMVKAARDRFLIDLSQLDISVQELADSTQIKYIKSRVPTNEGVGAHYSKLLKRLLKK